VYSSIVSLRGIRMLTYIAEHNGLEVWAMDIGNAYLETFTKEKVYIIARPEFGPLKGHTLLINKAIYGLKSSGLRWSERFSDVLITWDSFYQRQKWISGCMRRTACMNTCGVYVDNLFIISKNPKAITDALVDDYKFKLKGTGPVEFHLGCDFFRDEDGHLCFAPCKYIKKMLSNYEQMFGVLPKDAALPLEKGNHPELDSLDLLDLKGIKIYQSLIRCTPMGDTDWPV
jgi:hypothetical protein